MRARKRFGQHFLHDTAVLDRIAAAVHVRAEDSVLEIGPGRGALTEVLTGTAARYVAIEVDRDLAPYVRQRFPRIEVVRRMKRDGARYFGPYTSATACYHTLDALRRVFPYLDCDRTITGNDARPCLYYHIKMCGGPWESSYQTSWKSTSA